MMLEELEKQNRIKEKFEILTFRSTSNYLRARDTGHQSYFSEEKSEADPIIAYRPHVFENTWEVFGTAKRSEISYPYLHYHSWEHEKSHDSTLLLSEGLKKYSSLAEEAKIMTTFEFGWDGDDASTISMELLLASTTCMRKYLVDIYNEIKVFPELPKIHPVPNGSIDFEWNTARARLLINFRPVNEEIMGFYYGDLYNNKLPIKGNVPSDKVYDHLMKWMQNL